MTFQEWIEKHGVHNLVSCEVEITLEASEIWNAAIDSAKSECLVNAKRPHPEAPNAVGARNCMEIRDAIESLRVVTPKFYKTYCSQCGQEFGPGDHGYSHCIDHRNSDNG